MSSNVEGRLRDAGIVLPEAATPAGNYVPYVQSGSLVHIAGQIPVSDGALACVGTVGTNVSLEEAKAGARLVGLNILSQLKAACGGDLDRVVRAVKLNGYVNSAPDFTQHPQVINGCSELMVEAFGEAGRHARAAVGVASLPLGVAVEIDGIFEVR
jgi:enamine deaminase RidA (YjgF/YER057c/UK114 family)